MGQDRSNLKVSFNSAIHAKGKAMLEVSRCVLVYNKSEFIYMV
jgi:hypothetical protein